MSKTKILIAASAFILATLACNALVPSTGPTPTMVVIVEPTSPPTQDTLPKSEASVPRVSVEETRVALSAGAAIIVDVRSPDAYTLGHITGSINIPLGEIELNAGGLSLDREQWIITYCT
jgi:3-mercaptopyruvate sulfurtransferase SseA